jgi:hypothetical protein
LFMFPMHTLIIMSSVRRTQRFTNNNMQKEFLYKMLVKITNIILCRDVGDDSIQAS